jgi:hypothetical protein
MLANKLTEYLGQQVVVDNARAQAPPSASTNVAISRPMDTRCW